MTATDGIEEHDADLAADGDLVALVWEGVDEDDWEEDPDGVLEDDTLTEAHDIFVAMSTDGGETFAEALNLTNTRNPAPHTDVLDDEPTVAVSGGMVVIAYRQRGDENLRPEDLEDPGRTMVVRSTEGSAEGTWSEPEPLPGIEGTNTPAIHMDGDVVHVLACHEDDLGDPGDEEDNVLAYWRSDDGGESFDDPESSTGANPAPRSTSTGPATICTSCSNRTSSARARRSTFAAGTRARVSRPPAT